jgi:3-deoxy-manno-octulosonate cytidylyltransferase (CMP-KDO synthetase)
MNNDYKIVIPARFASTRLPGKPLLDIHGKPMIQHVYERAQQAGASEIVVATDSPKIGMAAEAFGATVCMTREDHVSGTDRLAEVVNALGWPDDTVVVNVQGDEPLIPPQIISQVAHNLIANPEAACATLMSAFEADEDVSNPNAVKVVTDAHGYALYFSRAAIPFVRDQQHTDAVTYYRHIGMYAYRAALLRNYAELPACELESIEKLEQLRLLWHGMKIHVAEALVVPPHGVDTEQDLEVIRSSLS